MIAYNTYLKQLLRRKVTLLIKLQRLEFFLEAFGNIVEMRNKFTNDVKQRGN